MYIRAFISRRTGQVAKKLFGAAYAEQNIINGSYFRFWASIKESVTLRAISIL